MIQTLIAFLRAIVRKEAARLIGYGSAGSVALTLLIANQFDFTVSPEILGSIALIGTWVVTESIRYFAFSEDTTQRLVTRAAETGSNSISVPDKGQNAFPNAEFWEGDGTGSLPAPLVGEEEV